MRLLKRRFYKGYYLCGFKNFKNISVAALDDCGDSK